MINNKEAKFEEQRKKIEGSCINFLESIEEAVNLINQSFFPDERTILEKEALKLNIAIYASINFIEKINVELKKRFEEMAPEIAEKIKNLKTD